MKKIGIKNFRVFSDYQEFELKPITILTGVNNSGKSTLHKLLLLLKKSIVLENEKPSLQHLIFDNEVVMRMGAYKNNLPYNSKSDEIVLSYYIDDECWGSLKLDYLYKHDKQNDLGILTQIDVSAGNLKLITYKYVPAKEYAERHFNEDYINNFEILGRKLNFFVWDDFFNFDKIDAITDKIYNYLLDEKKRAVKQYYLFILDRKIKKKETLTEFEKKLLQEFESEGLEFNTAKAQDEVVELEYLTQYHSNPHWAGYESLSGNVSNPYIILSIHDNKTNRLINIDKELDKRSQVYYDLDYRILIPTKLSSLVLGKTKLLSSDVSSDNKLETLKKELLKIGITNEREFIEKYKEFEQSAVALFISARENLSYLIFEFYQYQYYQNVSFKNYFYLNYTDYFNKIDRKIAIWEVLNSKAYKGGVLDDKFIISFKPEKNEFKEPLSYSQEQDIIKTVLTKARLLLLRPVKSLSEQLHNYTKNIEFHYHNLQLKRLYRFDSTNEEDLLFLEQGKLIIKNKKSDTINFINKWIKEFNLGDELVAEYSEFQNTKLGIGFFLKDNNTNYKKPVGDIGLGAHQILKLLMRIAFTDEKTNIKNQATLILEEPESNLHPAFQSKLADLISIGVQKNIRFIIETHSEYFIKKLQFLILKGELNKNDIIISNFVKDKEKLNIEQIKVNNQGKLNLEFGSDFFDEAAKLTTLSEIEARMQNKSYRCLVFTEDGQTEALENLLSSNNFKLKETLILSYNGKDNIKKGIFTAKYIKDIHPTIKQIIIHLDRDVFNDEDTPTINKTLRNNDLDKICTLFLTQGYDIESHYLNKKYIKALVPNISEELIKEIIHQATIECEDISLEKIGTAMQNKNNPPSPQKIVKKAQEKYNENIERYRYSKKVFYRVVEILKEQHNFQGSPYQKSSFLENSSLSNVAKKVWEL